MRGIHCYGKMLSKTSNFIQQYESNVNFRNIILRPKYEIVKLELKYCSEQLQKKKQIFILNCEDLNKPFWLPDVHGTHDDEMNFVEI